MKTELNGIKYEEAYVRKGDKDIIKLLEQNDMSLAEFIRLNHEHIENLEEQIQRIELIRRDIYELTADMLYEVHNTFSTDVVTLEDIKKATDRRQAKSVTQK